MKAKIIFTLLAISLSFIAFNNDAQAQSSNDQGSLFGKDSATCVMNISLYREFYRQWKDSRYKSESVNDAIGPWRWVVTNCPKLRQTTFLDGVRIMSYMIAKEKDELKRETYIDTLLTLYDQRIKYFGNEGSILGRKGIEFYKYRTSEIENAFNIFQRSVQIQKNKSQGPIIIYYFRTAVKMAKRDATKKALVVETYAEIMDIIDFNINKYQSNKSKLVGWQNVKGNIEAEFEPFATCEDLVSIYQKKFDSNKEDIELLKKITAILDKKKCIETQLYFDATIQLYKLEPSPESAYLIGKMFLKDGKTSDALTYLSEAVNIEDVDKRAMTYQYMAMCSQSLNKRNDARKYARKSISINPNNGDAYILIGDLYAASASSCGDNDLTNKVAYWAAVDQFVKAKRVDPSVKDVANKRISTYRKYFPTAETVFFYNLKEGDDYLVECWINENTKIRAAK